MFQPRRYEILEETAGLPRLSGVSLTANAALGMELTVAVSDERPVDARVVASCQQGDREAFRLLFETHKDKVYSIALYFFGGDAALASDITQQVFLKLFTRIGQFRHQSEFTTWLYRLTTNTCIDEQRKRRRFTPLPAALAEPSRAAGSGGSATPAAEARFMRLEIADSVREAIATLKPKLRIAILLKYFEELSYEEIAVALNCSKGTVASRLNRGHRILAQRLGHLRANVLSGD
jgi:RNA polymerase sigma-70 factor (ECF subfamily)